MQRPTPFLSLPLPDAICAHLLVPAIAMLTRTCSELRCHLAPLLVECKAKQLLSDLRQKYHLCEGNFVWGIDPEGWITAQMQPGCRCSAVDHSDITISGTLQPGRDMMIPEIDGGLSDCFERVRDQFRGASRLLATLNHDEEEINGIATSYNIGVFNGTTYKSSIPIRVMYKSDARVTFAAYGEIKVPAACMQGGQTFSDISTHINWLHFDFSVQGFTRT